MNPSHDHLLAETLRHRLRLAEDDEGRARGTDLHRPQRFLEEILLQSSTDAARAALEPAFEVGSTPVPAPALSASLCESCGGTNPSGAKFCGECGRPVSTVLAEPPMPTMEHRSPFRLVQLLPNGSDGESNQLPMREQVIGREGDIAYPADPLLSPRHARLSADETSLRVEDLGSLNGTFLKVRTEHRLQLGDTLILGRQLLRFERVEQVADPRARDADGTRSMGSPAQGAGFRLVQVGVGGVPQNTYLLYDTATSIGRERGDLVFPRDRFMSGKHAEVVARSDGHYYLVDKGSSNGSWVKCWEPTELTAGDRILVGQQTFRIEAS